MQFRQYHLSAVLKSLDLEDRPLDSLLSSYFRSHKALGSKDRQFIAETAYHFVRWKNLFQFLGINPTDQLPEKIDPTLPAFLRLGMPQDLFSLLASEYGEAKAEELSLISNGRAPLTVRINPLKTSRETLLNLWAPHYEVAPCAFSSLGINFKKRINFFTLPEFKAGLFEIQDEASQLAAELVRVKPKQHVLDYCAGAGGKSLAFAHLLQNSGQIYLHDIRPRALEKARLRFKRASVQNIQFSLPRKQVDWVVVDAPCTGTGTLRRNPDLKWRFSLNGLSSLVELQRSIFHDALSHLSPEGHIVYMTCSLLNQENEAQTAFFQERYSLEVVEVFKTAPLLEGMDGFYAVCFKKASCDTL